MRQAHIGGDKLFVDYAGDTVPVIVDRLTGQVRPAQIFVAVLGASNFTYAEASWTQALADWIGAHTRAFAALGGVPKLLVPDNTKIAVVKACLYEPQVNRTPAFAGAGSTPRWRRITIPRSCRHGPVGHATRRRWKSRC
jgi:transposase